MKRNLLKLLLLAFVFLTPLFAQDALACSCYGTSTPYQAFKEANAVFVGKVVGVSDASGKELTEDKLSELRDTAYKSHEATNIRYRFEIQELFKGKKVSEATIATSINMCESGFDVGESILIYAYESNGILGTGIFCSRTKWIETAQDDIYFLRELIENKSEPRIYGSVRLDDKDLVTDTFRYTFLEGIKIVAKNGKRRYVTVTDKNGLYRFYKIPNGKYEIYPELPKKYELAWFDLGEINLKTNSEPIYESYFKFTGSSAYSRFQVRWNNKINGNVLDAEGKPLERATVNLIPLNQVDNKHFPEDSVNAEELARESPESNLRKYEISGRTPGEYILAVEVFAPFISGTHKLRMYYPQATNLKDAEIINLKEFDNRKIDIKLPDGFVRREIEGSLVWGSGFPIEDGYVSLEKLENSEDKNNVVYDRQRVGMGRFKFQAFENAEYWLHAEFDKEKAKPIKIKVGKYNPPIKIVIKLLK